MRCGRVEWVVEVLGKRRWSKRSRQSEEGDRIGRWKGEEVG